MKPSFSNSCPDPFSVGSPKNTAAYSPTAFYYILTCRTTKKSPPRSRAIRNFRKSAAQLRIHMNGIPIFPTAHHPGDPFSRWRRGFKPRSVPVIFGADPVHLPPAGDDDLRISLGLQSLHRPVTIASGVQRVGEECQREQEKKQQSEIHSLRRFHTLLGVKRLTLAGRARVKGIPRPIVGINLCGCFLAVLKQLFPAQKNPAQHQYTHSGAGAQTQDERSKPHRFSGRRRHGRGKRRDGGVLAPGTGHPFVSRPFHTVQGVILAGVQLLIGHNPVTRRALPCGRDLPGGKHPAGMTFIGQIHVLYALLEGRVHQQHRGGGCGISRARLRQPRGGQDQAQDQRAPEARSWVFWGCGGGRHGVICGWEGDLR